MGPCSGRGARITMSCQCYAQCHRWGPISDATAVPSLSSSLLSWPSRSAVAIAATAVPPILLLRVRAPPRCHGQPEPSRPQRQSFKLSCCPGWPGPPSVRARPSVGIHFYPPPSTLYPPPLSPLLPSSLYPPPLSPLSTLNPPCISLKLLSPPFYLPPTSFTPIHQTGALHGSLTLRVFKSRRSRIGIRRLLAFGGPPRCRGWARIRTLLRLDLRRGPGANFE